MPKIRGESSDEGRYGRTDKREEIREGEERKRNLRKEMLGKGKTSRGKEEEETPRRRRILAGRRKLRRKRMLETTTRRERSRREGRSGGRRGTRRGRGAVEGRRLGEGS